METTRPDSGSAKTGAPGVAPLRRQSHRRHGGSKYLRDKEVGVSKIKLWEPPKKRPTTRRSGEELYNQPRIRICLQDHDERALLPHIRVPRSPTVLIEGSNAYLPCRTRSQHRHDRPEGSADLRWAGRSRWSGSRDRVYPSPRLSAAATSSRVADEPEFPPLLARDTAVVPERGDLFTQFSAVGISCHSEPRRRRRNPPHHLLFGGGSFAVFAAQDDREMPTRFPRRGRQLFTNRPARLSAQLDACFRQINSPAKGDSSALSFRTLG